MDKDFDRVREATSCDEPKTLPRSESCDTTLPLRFSSTSSTSTSRAGRLSIRPSTMAWRPSVLSATLPRLSVGPSGPGNAAQQRLKAGDELVRRERLHM